MSKARRIVGRQNLTSLMSLYSKQQWLLDKEVELTELFILCEEEENKALVIDLLGDFYHLEQRVLEKYLNEIAEFITQDSGFIPDKSQILSLTYDDDPDSSQKVLDYIKMPLGKNGWGRVKMVNKFGAGVKNFNKGFTQIILIDEFIGSGQTLLGRIKQLKADIKGEFELKICFLAGMEYAINIIEEQGYEVFCPLRLPKGISERYKGASLQDSIARMVSLERKLADSINGVNLSPTYMFGYNHAEALYSLEGCSGNTPNSVFPIFWWPQTINKERRNTLLFRFESRLQ